MSEDSEFLWKAKYQAKRLSQAIGCDVEYVSHNLPFGYTFKIEIPNINVGDDVVIRDQLFYYIRRYGFTIDRQKISFSDRLSCTFFVQCHGGPVVIDTRVLPIEEVIAFVKGEDVSE